jgi:hypothetical protein
MESGRRIRVQRRLHAAEPEREWLEVGTDTRTAKTMNFAADLAAAHGTLIVDLYTARPAAGRRPRKA